MTDVGESPETWRGMPVEDAEGRPLGRLEGTLDDETTGMGRFLLVGRRLVPVEALESVEKGRLRMRVPEETFRQMPTRDGDGPPPWSAMQRAYELVGVPGPVAEARTRDVPPARRATGARPGSPAEGYGDG